MTPGNPIPPQTRVPRALRPENLPLPTSSQDLFGSRSPREGLYALQGLPRSEEHTSELQSHLNLVCRLLLEKKKFESKRQVTPFSTSSISHISTIII